MGFCFADAHEDINWEGGYETLDTQLQEVIRDAANLPNCIVQTKPSIIKLTPLLPSRSKQNLSYNSPTSATNKSVNIPLYEIETMTVETINATLFPVLLFIVFFSTACWFLYNPAETDCNHHSTVFTTFSDSQTITAKNEISCPSSSTVETPETLTQKPPAVEPKQPIPEAITINTQFITLRQARKIASAIKKANPSLGIQQKVNGSDVSVEWLRIQIKNRLEQAPELVTPIILELAPAAFGIQSLSTKTSRSNPHQPKAS